MSKRTHSKQTRTRNRRRAAVFALAVGAVFAVGAVALFAGLQRNIQTAPLRVGDSPAPAVLPTEGMNVLLLGSDSRGASGEGGNRSDAIVLLHLAENDARIDAVQIPRDTVGELPECAGGYGMINSALNSGPACSVEAMQHLTGLPIDHFVELDFGGFATMVDALGGLPVCLPDPLQDSHAGLDLPAGPQTVDGANALALARTRHSIGDGSDLSRLGHQQMVMSAIVQRAASLDTLTRPDRMLAFLDAATASVTVDPGLSRVSDLGVLAARLMRVPAKDVTFLVMPWAVSPDDANRVVPGGEAATVFSQLAADAPLNLDGSPSSEEVSEDADDLSEGEPEAIEQTPLAATSRKADAPLCG